MYINNVNWATDNLHIKQVPNIMDIMNVQESNDSLTESTVFILLGNIKIELHIYTIGMTTLLMGYVYFQV